MRAVGDLNGLDFLNSVLSGSTPPPPASKLIGYRISEFEWGSAVFELQPEEYHYNPFGTVHGGIASSILDTSIMSAVMSTLPADLICSTLEIKVNFIRPITKETGILRCEAKTIHVGKRIATAEGKITDVDGNLFAHAIGTCMIFSKGQD